MLPVRGFAARGDQCQADAATVSIIEQLTQQAFGLTQGLMSPGRGGCIDNDQP